MLGPAEHLHQAIAGELQQPVAAPVAAMADAIRARHPAGSIAAILFYGSCLRRNDPTEGVLDFYLLVDDYRSFYGRRLPAAANAVLPPNVFYAEHVWNGVVLRAKYAVITLSQFARGTSRGSLQSALWARFAQPARLVQTRDAAAAAMTVSALADAVATFVGAVAPVLAPRFTASDLWTKGFAMTYASELRSEGPDRALELYRADQARYDALTEPALAAAGLTVGREAEGTSALSLAEAAREAETRRWRRRRVVGKLLNLLRLVKGAFTFEGALDYVLWKVERHSGVRVAASSWQRRHPLLAAPVLAWRLYRLGGFR